GRVPAKSNNLCSNILIYIYIESMSKINKLPTSFIKKYERPRQGEEPGRIQHLRIHARRRGAGVSKVRPAATETHY
ncbi:MAG: hypothetical protein ACKPKO_35890, partial [Candidatus Fonsibacter sp.]